MKKMWRFLLLTMVIALVAPPSVSADVVGVGGVGSPVDIHAAQEASGGEQTYRCNDEFGMYVTVGACKYARAAYESTCTVRTTSGSCYERRITKMLVRGGTADTRSPSRTGSCRYGSTSSFQKWQTIEMWIVDSGKVVYYHEGIPRDNCDIEAGPFWVSPNVLVRDKTYILFNFKHFCRAGEPCGDQTGYTHFFINYPN